MPSNTGKTTEQIQAEIDAAKTDKGTETDGAAADINAYKIVTVEALLSKDVGCKFAIPDYAIIGLGGFKQVDTGVKNEMIVLTAQSVKKAAKKSNKTKPRELGNEVTPDNSSGKGAVYGHLIRIGKPVIVPVTIENSLKQDYKGKKRIVKQITIRVHPLMTVTAIARFLQAFGTPPTWFRLKGGQKYNITKKVADASLGETPPSLKKIVDSLKKAA